MKVSELADALRGSNPEAEVVTCLEIPDGEGDYLLFSECPPSLAEPYPGDDGRFLVHAALTLGELVDAVMAAAAVMRGEKTMEDITFKIPNDGQLYHTKYPRPDALGKVLGVTDYADDIRLKMPEGMLEMADVFRLSVADRIRSIYLSQALPSFEAACSLALGFCWKAGIAAEVIGLPDHTIGDHLHDAKIYLDTPSLFAWTLAIIVLSLIIEKAVRALISRAVAHVEAHA